MAEDPEKALACNLLDNPNPKISKTSNLLSAIDHVSLYFSSHLTIFAVPSTLCFIGAVATYVKTQSFASLVEKIGEGNATLLFAVISMLWFPLLNYLKKLRRVDKNRFFVKKAVDSAFFFTNICLCVLYYHLGNIVLVLCLLGCAVNLADFAGFGGPVSHECMTTIVLGNTLATMHWGFTFQSQLFSGALLVYLLIRIWVFGEDYA